MYRNKQILQNYKYQDKENINMGYGRIRPRRGTLSKWELANPILAEGELAFVYSNDKETNSPPLKIKVGNGRSRFNDLPYAYEQDRVTLVRPSTINGNIRIDNKETAVYRPPYVICNTVGTEATKTVSYPGFAPLVVGSSITVKFTEKNFAEDVKIDVENTGEKPIYYKGEPIDPRIINKDDCYTLKYDGTNYEIVGDLNLPFLDKKGSFYVSSTIGSDQTGDGSKEKPFATIQCAIDNCPCDGLRSKNNVHIMSGTYNETVLIQNTCINFFFESDVMFDGNGLNVSNPPRTAQSIFRIINSVIFFYKEPEISDPVTVKFTNANYCLTLVERALLNVSADITLEFDQIFYSAIHMDYSDLIIQGQLIVNPSCDLAANGGKNTFIGAYMTSRIVLLSPSNRRSSIECTSNSFINSHSCTQISINNFDFINKTLNYVISSAYTTICSFSQCEIDVKIRSVKDHDGCFVINEYADFEQDI